MAAETRKIDYAIAITFFAGIISIVYFVTTLFLIDSDPSLIGLPASYLSWMIVERLIVIGIIIVILILISYLLIRERNTEKTTASRVLSKVKKSWRNEKALKEDLKRYYRDMGALKIVLKDGVIDTETYNERKKYLEGMIRKRKKELKELAK